MFKKNQPSDMKPENFGVGSIVILSRKQYLVCGSITSLPARAWLLDCDTFIHATTFSDKIDDLNWFSEDEARQLIGLLDVAFSDVDIDTRGLKGTIRVI
jgi:hypothetical protein